MSELTREHLELARATAHGGIAAAKNWCPNLEGDFSAILQQIDLALRALSAQQEQNAVAQERNMDQYVGSPAPVPAAAAPSWQESPLTDRDNKIAAGQAHAGDWPEDSTHENGNYQNRCLNCQDIFIGHKRRNTCKLCAAPAAPVSGIVQVEGNVKDGPTVTTVTPAPVSELIERLKRGHESYCSIREPDYTGECDCGYPLRMEAAHALRESEISKSLIAGQYESAERELGELRQAMFEISGSGLAAFGAAVLEEVAALEHEQWMAEAKLQHEQWMAEAKLQEALIKLDDAATRMERARGLRKVRDSGGRNWPNWKRCHDG